MADYESLDNYQSELESNMELRERILKLEDLLLKKHTENDALIKMHEDFKLLHERTRKECLELNQKLIQAYEKKNLQEKKYEGEIQKLKTYFDKQKEIYETQIIKLSSHETDNLKNKITAEVELKYKHLIAQKDLEIDNMGDQIFDWKKKFELLNTEYETFKNDAIREIDMIKENHKSEVKEFLYKIQLLNDKSDSNMDKEAYRSMKQELETYRRNFNDLQTEISNLRKEKELLLSEKNETKINLLKELDTEKLKIKMLNNDNEKYTQIIKNLETEVNNHKTKLDEKHEEIKNLMNEKFSLVKELRNQESEYESFKNEIRLLRTKVSEKEKEYDTNLKLEHEKEKQRFIQEKSEKEEYQSKIEELTLNLKNVQIDFKNFYEKNNEELHAAKRDFYIISEEKRNLIRKVSELQQDLENIKEDYGKKSKNSEYYEREYTRLEAMFRDLSGKEAENNKTKVLLENLVNKKDEEISQLQNLVKKYEGEERGKVTGKSYKHNEDSKDNEIEKIKREYMNKLDEVEKKKKHYKKQVI
jgi:hypothetical protein